MFSQIPSLCYGTYSKWAGHFIGQNEKELPELQTAEKNHSESHPISQAGNSLSINVASHHFTFQCNLLELFAHRKLIINIQIFYILLVLSHICPISHCSVCLFLTQMEDFTFTPLIFYLVILGSSYQPAMNLLS